MFSRVAAGLGYRDEIAADLLRFPDAVDFVEVVAESCFVRPAARREARAVAELWPVIPHGVKLSLGAAEGVEKERAKALGDLAKDLRAPFISEHVAFVRSGSREIGHLTGLPLTRTAVNVVARNVDRARKWLPDVPLLLENIAWTFQWPESEMAEPDFYCEIARRTGCPLLLDVGNLYANAINLGQDPITFARQFPLERVAMIHLAGGIFEDSFYFDDHAHAVSDSVFGVLRAIVEMAGPVPILIERDAQFPPFAELRAEVDQCRRILRHVEASAELPSPTQPVSNGLTPPSDLAALQRDQDDVARQLVDVDPDLDPRFEARAMVRSRTILQRKRVDEALPLLSFLAPHRPRVEKIAHRVVVEEARRAKLAAIADAFEIATRALHEPALRAAAERDLLSLETRFICDSRTKTVRPRNAPFFQVRPLSGGTKAFAFKGFGPHARVHVHERKSAST